MRFISALMPKLQLAGKHIKLNNSVKFSTKFDIPNDIIEEPPQGYEKVINEVRLLGRIGRDPLYLENNGKTGVLFILGTKKEETPEHAEWHSIFTFDPTLMKSVQTYLRKGVRVYVSGMLSSFYDMHSNKKSVGVRMFRFICF